MANLDQKPLKFTIRGAALAFNIARNTLRKRLRATGQVPEDGLYTREQIEAAIGSVPKGYRPGSATSASPAKLRELKARCKNVELKNDALLAELVNTAEIKEDLAKAFDHIGNVFAGSALDARDKRDLRENLSGWLERIESITRSKPGRTPGELDLEEDDGDAGASEFRQLQDRESRARAFSWELRNDLATGIRLLRSDVYAALELTFISATQIVYSAEIPREDQERLLNLVCNWQASDPVTNKLLQLCRPREVLKPSEWQERYRMQPADSAKSGRWRNFVYQIEPLDSVLDPNVSSLTLQFCSQLLGKSAIIEGLLCWMIDQQPCSALAVHPTLSNAISWSKNKFSPLIDGTERLAKLVNKVTPKRVRGSGENTITHKKYPGGWFLAGGSNSPSQLLRAHSVKWVLADEVDAYKDSAGADGDILTLAEQRSIRFPDSFSIQTSTPSAKGFSRIEKTMSATDERRWFCRCVRCNHQFVLMWAHVKWPKIKVEGKPTKHSVRETFIECPCCQAHLTESDRIAMIEAGEWIPTNPEVTGKRGYYGNGLMVLGPTKRGFTSWLHFFASEFLAKRKLGVAGLRPFTNLILGESFEVEGATPPDWELLFNRREVYPEYDGEVLLDKSAGLVVAGVDVQANRLEVAWTAFSETDASWGLQYLILDGNPERREVWDQLFLELQRTWRSPGGRRLGAHFVCLDSNFMKDQCAKFCKNTSRRDLTVRPTVGKPGFDRVWCNASRNDPLLTLLQVDTAKEMIYRRLRITDHESPEFMHYPVNPQCGYDAEYFRKLVIEVVVDSKGHPHWEKKREQDRNESLDLAVLCLGAKELAKPDWPRVHRWLESTPPETDWRPEQQRRQALLSLDIPDLRDVPSPATIEAGFKAILNKYPGAKKWVSVT
jgi:phage terminase large subunit GpA-like protein